MQWHKHKHYKYKYTNNYGVKERSVISEDVITGAIMPINTIEFTANPTEAGLIQSIGRKIVNFSKIYIKIWSSSIDVGDIIVDVYTGVEYMCLRVSDYSRYGALGTHIKVVLGEI